MSGRGQQKSKRSKGKDTQAKPAAKSDSQPTSVESLAVSFTDFLMDMPKGVLATKLKYPVNFQKSLTFAFVLIMMSYYNNYSLGCYVYLALHGSYGLIWMIKDQAMPDASFEKKTGFLTTLFTITLLAAYWVMPYLQASGQGINKPSGERIAVCTIMFAVGVVIMMVSDAQKTFTLKIKKGLINDGLFKYCRNPNYLGEIMVYASFANATGNPTSWAIVGTVWCTLFLLRMITKDASLRSKEGGKEYFEQSSLLLPKIFFRNTFLHYLAWGAIFAVIYKIHQIGGLQVLFSSKRSFF